MQTLELKKASMAFELKDGTIILISKEDVNEIAHKLVLEMIMHHQNRVIMYKSSAIEKINTLYTILTSEKDKMSDDVRQQYYQTIIGLIKDDAMEQVSLKDEIDKK